MPDDHPTRLAPEHRVMAARDDEQQPDEAEDGTRRAPPRTGSGRRRMVSTLPPGGAEQVDGGVLHAPVHALGDLPVQVEHVHVEGEVERREVEERAGEDPPPLARAPRTPALMRFCSPSGPTEPPKRPPARVVPPLSAASMPNRPTQMAMIA